MNVQRIVANVRQDRRSCQNLKSPVLNILNSIDPRGLEMRPFAHWAIDVNTSNFSGSAGNRTRSRFSLSAEETARYVRIVSQSQAIRRHVDLFAWLMGEVQQFLPHEIFISAWGSFANWDLRLDVISALPGVRTEQLLRHSIDDVLRVAHQKWIEGGRQPLLFNAREALQSMEGGANSFYASMREMRSMLVHGIRDERGGHESLYIALNRGSCTKGGCRDRFLSLVDSLMPQIDIAFRRIAAFPLGGAVSQPNKAPRARGIAGHELSSREQEILGWICQGKTNVEIADTLKISPFTVKNHVQRIFKKIGVSSRMQAATKYSAALSELRKYFELSEGTG
ncbi:MAG: XrtB/PEP-CTERM-associated transcriptional regulator EpsA [Burkholderiales bacterium]